MEGKGRFWRYLAGSFDSVVKLLLLAVLVWIGIGLQDVADAIYALGDSCGADLEGSVVRHVRRPL